MNRSTINALIRDAESFLAKSHFLLPPFAYWSPQDWSNRGRECREIVERRLGWDITDFGSGHYAECGLFVFTLRNGNPDNLKMGRGKLYAEKALIVDPNQVTPLHFHWLKTEDIINRGGGDLIVRLYNATHDELLDTSDVLVWTDGVERVVQAGGTLSLAPGESITLTPRIYHEFWAASSRVLAGEVSTVNDDYTDNRFYEQVGRFPEIEEDESPVHLLVNDYERYVPQFLGQPS